MKKLFIIFGLLLFSTGVNAGICNNGSVATSSGYTFSLTNTGGSSGQNTSVIDAGRMVFNGAGAMSVSGFEYSGGGTRTISVNGTYSITSSCVMTATFKLPPLSSLTTEKTFTVTVYLDRLDIAQSVNVAYHGNAIFRTSNSMSGIGVFDRVIGKF
ncbi:MAG: hypothetical protein IPN42_12390 [Methylococcaceae bacterium]|nr:hypothetical protein [Methylococcaceae bacterium]